MGRWIYSGRRKGVKMTLKEFVLKLGEEARKESDMIEEKRKKEIIGDLEYLRNTARNNGKLEILNNLMGFIIENKI